jgi:hypothetical protein
MGSGDGRVRPVMTAVSFDGAAWALSGIELRARRRVQLGFVESASSRMLLLQLSMCLVTLLVS